MVSWRELKAGAIEAWQESAGEVRETGIAFLRIVIPVAIVSMVSLFLWFEAGYRVAAVLLDALADAYQRNPMETVKAAGIVFAVALLARYAMRRSRRVMGLRRVVAVDPASAGMVVMGSSLEPRSMDPMQAEFRAVAKKYGRSIAEYAIAKSFPGESLDAILARADDAVLDLPPLTLVGIARHEAAHTVSAHALGAVPIRAEVYGVDEGGYARWSYPEMASRQHNFYWISLVISLAGNLADQAEGRGNSGSHGDLRSADQDVYRIISNGIKPDGYEGELDASSLINAAREKARPILHDHQFQYETLATELLEHRRLNSHQIRDILSLKDIPEGARNSV